MKLEDQQTGKTDRQHDYSERDTAYQLGISIQYLRQLVTRYLVEDQTEALSVLTFRATDLMLLRTLKDMEERVIDLVPRC